MEGSNVVPEVGNKTKAKKARMKILAGLRPASIGSDE